MFALGSSVCSSSSLSDAGASTLRFLGAGFTRGGAGFERAGEVEENLSTYVRVSFSLPLSTVGRGAAKGKEFEAKAYSLLGFGV